MRLDGTFRNEHSFRDFGIGVPVGCENHRLAFPLRQSVEHGARLIAARLRLLSIEIVDELSLAGRIELGQAILPAGQPEAAVQGHFPFGHPEKGAVPVKQAVLGLGGQVGDIAAMQQNLA